MISLSWQAAPKRSQYAGGTNGALVSGQVPRL
jgi:hypothetical protein